MLHSFSVTVDCAKLQLELLKLYKPGCLEILETLRDMAVSNDQRDDTGDCNYSGDEHSRNNQVDDGPCTYVEIYLLHLNIGLGHRETAYL